MGSSNIIGKWYFESKISIISLQNFGWKFFMVLKSFLQNSFLGNIFIKVIWSKNINGMTRQDNAEITDTMIFRWSKWDQKYNKDVLHELQVEPVL